MVKSSTVSAHGKNVGALEERCRDEEKATGEYRIFFEQSPDAMYITSRDGKFTEFNQAALDLFGYSREEMMGLDVRYIYVNPAERDSFQEKIEQEEFVKDYELKLCKKDGTEMYCLVTANVNRDAAMAILGYQGIIRDITRQKQVEQGLRESEEKYRSLASTEDSIYLVDRNGRYLFMNESHLSRLGSPDAPGKTYAELHSGEETKEFTETLEEAFRTGFSVQHEHQSRRDGRYFLRTLTPVRQPEGRTVAVTVVSKDITTLKKARQDLEKAHQELKETTVQLIHTERLSALGQLTAAIAHELNQPLNNMKIISQSLLRDIEKNRLDVNTLPQDLNGVIGQVNKMAKVIDHMRVYTRRLEEVHDEIGINEPLENIFMLMGWQLKVHGVEMIKDLAPDLPGVSGNPINLEQVFTNLIVNAQTAVEAFREKGRRIEIKSFRRNDKEVAVSIKDNGGGVPLSIRGRIFEPFFTSKPSGQGTGLGLTICKKIIEDHGGRIELEVDEGEGSTFTVVLPAVLKGENKC